MLNVVVLLFTTSKVVVTMKMFIMTKEAIVTTMKVSRKKASTGTSRQRGARRDEAKKY